MGVTYYSLASVIKLCLVLTEIVADFKHSANPSNTVMRITLFMMQYHETGVLQLILE